MSPYIVTTRRPEGYAVSRRAVATLEEAREVVWEVLPAGSAWAGRAFTGGTVTLPDGTVIEVERTTWNALADALNGPQFVWPASTEAAQRAQIDAFNARQS
jgi:hypothetical protein